MRATTRLRWLYIILILTVVLAGCNTGKPLTPNNEMTETTTIQATAAPIDPEETTMPTAVPIETINATEPKAEPLETQPPATEPPSTTPPITVSAESNPPETAPPITKPPTAEPPAPLATESAPTTPPVTEPAETAPPETEPAPTTEPPQTEPPEESKPTAPTEEFKQEVAYYAAYHINQYRIVSGAPACTVLPGMTQVAEYRADQLTYNYAHDTDDKRAALAYYQYGRWVDATIVGLDPSQNYYEADTSEAICAGFEGKTAEEMGKRIADMCRNSSSHWSYIGSSKNLYIGIGVEYRAGSTYGWYGCIMVGRTNYG